MEPNPTGVGVPHTNMGLGKLSMSRCVKLVILTLLQNPRIGEKYAYPVKVRREPQANYYRAYVHRDEHKHADGWTGQELMELINLIFPTKWRALPHLVYNMAIKDLMQFQLIKETRRESVQKGHNSIWYTLNNNPDGDASRPIDSMIAQDRADLAADLRDSLKFLTTMDELCYGGTLLK